ncbi:Methionyl-tRNA formyltransferase [Hyella patelloides LEGE 07179]|uniref:Methionyl-tRNA formyltransferase n=2 Tax=Hyella TaxID=945733 RepID=A0A563VZ71_9CYAN|nr:methionyl-tRNA formyltransferase [Hyella patelloides]VEP16731.1 Methionyl-tRNA formyltransferase [Hyella patelloides LEGE 07179]
MMQIIFFGTPQFAVPTLEALIKHPDLKVIAVVTQPDKRRGRGNKTIPSAVKKVAVEHNIEVWQPKSVKKNRETLDKLQQVQADAFVVVAYGQILSQEILDLPKFGCINVHGSLLPQYRGAAPIQWSLYHGDAETGITTMLMDEGLDTGDMLLKAQIPINLLDNAVDVAIKLANQGADLLIETLQKLKANTITPTPQDDALSTYARLIEKSDYKIDWQQEALTIHNQVRAFYPSCVTTFREQQLKVKATVPLIESKLDLLPSECQVIKQKWQDLVNLSGSNGEVVAILKNLGAVVQTKAGLLLLKEVQLAGKKAQSGWDFVNGMRVTEGERMNEEE